MITRDKAIKILRRQFNSIKIIAERPRLSNDWKKWKRDTQVAIEQIFGQDTRHIKDFDNISYAPIVFASGMPESFFDERFQEGLAEASSILASMINEINEYWKETPQDAESETHIATIEKICKRFHLVAKQLRSRHSNRETLKVEDEYDVQDLFHAILIIEFSDIRPEESTPSYAGGASRMDFLLKDEQIVIEVKKTRKGLAANEIGQQLMIDIQRYQSHPDCQVLVCFIYDPELRIANPRGIEKDLSCSKNGLEVKVIIVPQGI